MISIPTSAHPLSWPVGVPRTPSRYASPFGANVRSGGTIVRSRPEVGSASRELARELKLIRGSSRHVISSNLPTRPDGLPYADATLGRGRDPGACAYWVVVQHRAGTRAEVPYCMPCDRWLNVADNLHALALSIGALRGMERWGAVKMEQAFAGFAALPPGDGSAPEMPTTKRPWREVLGMPDVAAMAPAAQLAIAKALHRVEIEKHHTDRGGDPARASEINVAYDDAKQELGGPR